MWIYLSYLYVTTRLAILYIQYLQTPTLRHMASPSSYRLNQKYVNDNSFINRINAAQNSWTAKAYKQHEQ